MNETLNTHIERAAQISNDRVYTQLLDSGLDPKEAWDATFSTPFNLVEDVAVNG